MKKLMLAALCLVMTGCSSGERPAPSSFDTASSVRFDFTDREGFTDQGAVYLDGDILHFADAESGLDTVICPKADCKHEGESHENPHPTCNGWVEGINTTCPMLTNGHLYFLYTPDMKNGGYSGFGVKKLCRADKDGTNRQDIAELDDAQEITAACCDGKRLAVAYRCTFDEHGESLDKLRSFVSLIDLESGERFTSECFEGWQLIINKLWLDGDRIWLSKTDTEEDIDLTTAADLTESIRSEIVCVDVSSNEASSVYSGKEGCADISDGYAVTDRGKLISLEDGSITDLGERSECSYCLCSEGVIIGDYRNGKFSFYCFEDGSLRTLAEPAQDKWFNIAAVTESCVYVMYPAGDDLALGVMDRENFLGGKGADIKKLL